MSHKFINYTKSFRCNYGKYWDLHMNKSEPPSQSMTRPTPCFLLQWFEEKLQEVESADQHFRKLHALVETLVVHRKG